MRPPARARSAWSALIAVLAVLALPATSACYEDGQMKTSTGPQRPQSPSRVAGTWEGATTVACPTERVARPGVMRLVLTQRDIPGALGDSVAGTRQTTTCTGGLGPAAPLTGAVDGPLVRLTFGVANDRRFGYGGQIRGAELEGSLAEYDLATNRMLSGGYQRFARVR
jgi:hypothetical protein